MKVKNILMISLVFLIIASVGSYYCFIYANGVTYDFNDVSFKAHEENIFLNQTESDLGCNYYNGHVTTVKVFNTNKLDFAGVLGTGLAFNIIKDYPNETFNGKVMYHALANRGENADDERYITFVKENNITVMISSPSLDETDYIAESVKIKK